MYDIDTRCGIRVVFILEISKVRELQAADNGGLMQS